MRAPDFRAAALVFLQHPADPLWLAGQVAVIRAVLDAGPDQRFTIERVGADRGGNRPGRRAHCAQCVVVAGIGHDDRQFRGAAAQRLAKFLEFRLRAPGYGPAQPAAKAEFLVQVPGQDLPDKTGCTEYDEVVGLPGSGH